MIFVFFAKISFTFLFLIFSFDTPNFISSLSIKVCNASFYDEEYYQNLKVPLNPTLCILKDQNTELFRKIFIQNASNSAIKKTSDYDQVYLNLADAFFWETLLMIKYCKGVLEIKMEVGDHYIRQTDLLIENPEFFRMSLVNIKISPEKTEKNTRIILKTNHFHLFISRNFYVSDIIFIGNDINWVSYEAECYQKNEFCCQKENFKEQYNESNYYKYCNFQNFPLIQNSKKNFYGMFNLEYIINLDNLLPNLTIFSCKFKNLHFLNGQGFLSLFSLAPYSGVLIIDSCFIEDSLFPQGFVYFSKSQFDQIYTDFTISNIVLLEEAIFMKNITAEFYNFYQVKNENYEINFFNLFGYNGIFSINFCYFSFFLNINSIFKLSNFNKNIEIVSSSFRNISEIQENFIFGENIQNLSIQNLLIENYRSSNNHMFYLQNVSLLICDSLNLTNFLLNREMGNCFEISISKINVKNSFFAQGIFNIFLNQENFDAIISNSTFLNLSFGVSFISFSGQSGVVLECSSFSRISGQIYLFVLYKGNHFVVRYLIFEYILIYSFFYFVDALLNINQNIDIMYSIFGYIWEKDIVCKQITTNFSEIRKNIVTACLFRDLSIDDVAFSLLNVFIVENIFIQTNSAGMIQTQMGSCTFDKAYFITNYFFNYNIFRYLMEIAIFCKFVAKNSFFIDNGIIVKKSSYFGYNDNNIIALWSIFYSHFENIVMMVTDNTEMLGGFISASPHYGVFELQNSVFITQTTNQIFEYKGIQIDSFLYGTLINNTFYNLKCNSRSFSTKYGGVNLFASSSYAFSKGQNNYSLFMKNNTFFNSSCVYGGGLAIFAINKIEIEDLFFYGSVSEKKGGAFILVGSEICQLKNVYISNSNGLEGGGAFIQNIFTLTIFNIYIENSTAIANGILYCQNILEFNITNITTKNTQVGMKGGVFTIFRSGVTLFSGNFSNSYSKVEGGILFCEDRSSLYLNNLSIQNCFSEKGGAISIANALNFSILNCTINQSSSTHDGSAFLKSFAKVEFENIKVENSKSLNGTGVILIMNNDDNSLITLKNIICRNNSALEGSCILFISTSFFFVKMYI